MTGINGRRFLRSSIFKVLVSFLLCSSCATGIWPFNQDNNEQTANSPSADATSDQKEISSPNGGSKPRDPRASTAQDVELKQAKIWNRLDEIEEQLRTQKEQIKLLEQGLLTGIPPESLKNRSSGSVRKGTSREGAMPQRQFRSSPDDLSNLGLPAPVVDKQDLPQPNEQDKSDPDGYRVKMQVAKEYYQGSRFGLAIAELAQISKTFGSKSGDGEVKYYLGRSYLGLKEYLSARTELEAFVKEFPGNPSAGMARLDLAKAYAGLNLRERARKELASVAKEYEGREEGDMAANELKSLRGAL